MIALLPCRFSMSLTLLYIRGKNFHLPIFKIYKLMLLAPEVITLNEVQVVITLIQPYISTGKNVGQLCIVATAFMLGEEDSVVNRM